MEIITARHFLMSAPLVLIISLVTRNILLSQADKIIDIYNAIGYVGFFFLISLPSIGLQFIENKYLWSKFLLLKDNLSFFGISIGIGIGVFSLGKW